METVVNKLLELLAALGLGVLLVLGVGFWLFYQIKRESDARNEPHKPNPPRPPDHP
jgi:uncharacterized membrane protein